VQRITGGKGAYAAFDGVGQTTFEASLASLGYLGWLVSFGNASGKVPPVDLLRWAARRRGPCSAITRGRAAARGSWVDVWGGRGRLF
jgi:NADPH:quinone reductase-like Zn-dependent oxidoreductase